LILRLLPRLGVEVYGVSVAPLGGVDEGVECWDTLCGCGVTCGTTAGDRAALDTLFTEK